MFLAEPTSEVRPYVPSEKLVDGYGRRFEYLRLSLTELCNFKCNYCLPDGNDCTDREFLTQKEAQTVVAAFAQLGTSKVRLTGGEPTLRRDLIDIIAQTKAISGIEKVALTTNGYKLTRKIKAYHDAGLDALNVSVDAFDPKQFHLITGVNRLQHVLEGVDEALSIGVPQVKINSVLMNSSFNQGVLSRSLEYIRPRPVSVRFIELMRTNDNADFYRQNHVSGQKIQAELIDMGWQPMIRDRTAGPAIEYRHPDYEGRIGLIMPYSKDFCVSCNRLRVSSHGKLHLCLFAEEGIDLRSALADGDIDTTKNLIQSALISKEEAHPLHQSMSGGTRHLAMLGG